MAKGQELKDLDVDRVDGVDRPATGRNFLLFKNEDGAAAVMKGYAMCATAGAEVLKAIRKDRNAVVSRKSAIALNGLAQVLGQDAVFVGKSVPTQPYLFGEPDADERGPSDENLGGNFSPRSMPGSMVGRVQFRVKDESEDEDDRKSKGQYDEDEEDRKAKATVAQLKAAYLAAKQEADEEEDEDERKAKARKARKAKSRYQAVKAALLKQDERLSDGREDSDEYSDDAAGAPSRAGWAKPGKVGKAKPPAYAAHDEDDDNDDDMDAAERQNRGVARSVKSLEATVAKMADVLAGLTGHGQQFVTKGEERTERVRPSSRQAQGEENYSVRKSDYAPRFQSDFSNIVFGR